jgi:hypothetical protein
MFKWLSSLFGRSSKPVPNPYAASNVRYVARAHPHTSGSSTFVGRSRAPSDDDTAVTGSAVLDGVIGIPSSPTAFAIDLATRAQSYDGGASTRQFR